MKWALRSYSFAAAISLTWMPLERVAGFDRVTEWTDQFGSAGFDAIYSVAADGSGNVYVSGTTTGDIGAPNVGRRDFFVRKYTSTGSVLWSRQFGTPRDEEGLAVAVDQIGNVYVSGSTGGSLASPTNGGSDAFLSRLDPSGDVLWTRQLGSGAGDSSWDVLPDAFGNVFIVGQTLGNFAATNQGSEDAFLSKFDAAGTLAWTRQFGDSDDDVALGIASDGQGGVYVTGVLAGRFGYVSRFDGAGTEIWHEKLDAVAHSYGSGVVVDEAGSVYVLGSTEGSPGWPHAGGRDVFVNKYSASGDFIWRQHLGSSLHDYGADIAMDASGRVYICGETTGDIAGENAGELDVFVASLDTSGQLRWARQMGTAQYDVGRSISVDGLGSVYVAGATTGILGNTAFESTDAFILKIVEVPEPAGFVLMLFASLLLPHRFS